MSINTLELPDDLAEQLRALAAARGEDWNHFAIAVLAQSVKSAPAASEEQRARAEARAVLNGPFHPFDPDANYKKYAAKYGLPDLSHLSDEELSAQADEAVARMDPAARAQLEREGLL